MKYIVIAALFLGLAAPANAADPKEVAMKLAKPGKAHKKLAPLVGKWTTVTRAFMSKGKDGKPRTFKGKVAKSWTLDGRFIHEQFKGKGPYGKPYTGIGYLGYDNGAQRFQGVWMSSYGTAMVLYAGPNAKGKKLTFTGKEKDPTGKAKTLAFKMVLEFKSKDEHTLTQFYDMPGKGPVKAFEIVHTRVK